MSSIFSKIRTFLDSGKPYQGIFEVVGKSEEWKTRFPDFTYFRDGDWNPKPSDDMELPWADPGSEGTYQGVPAITVIFDPDKTTPEAIVKWFAKYGLGLKFITGVRTSRGPLN